MKIIAFVNNKGGVGKTTCSRTTAEYFSKNLKLRTLGVDFDPQCNFSNRFINMEIDTASREGRTPPIHPHYDINDPNDSDWDGRSSIADIFYGNGVIPYPTYIEQLDIAPAYGEKLLAAEAVRKDEVVYKVHNRLAEFLNSEDVKAEYDIVVIDTAPSKGPLTFSVIKAATHIIIPAVMEEQVIEGVYGMMQLWMQESLRRHKNNPLNLIGILPTLFKKTTLLHNQMLESLKENRELRDYIMPVQINNRIIFPELDSQNASPHSIFDLPDSHKAKIEALEVFGYIAKKVLS